MPCRNHQESNAINRAYIASEKLISLFQYHHISSAGPLIESVCLPVCQTARWPGSRHRRFRRTTLINTISTVTCFQQNRRSETMVILLLMAQWMTPLFLPLWALTPDSLSELSTSRCSALPGFSRVGGGHQYPSRTIRHQCRTSEFTLVVPRQKARSGTEHQANKKVKGTLPKS